jgi:hypothetical protein
VPADGAAVTVMVSVPGVRMVVFPAASFGVMVNVAVSPALTVDADAESE